MHWIIFTDLILLVPNHVKVIDSHILMPNLTLTYTFLKPIILKLLITKWQFLLNHFMNFKAYIKSRQGRTKSRENLPMSSVNGTRLVPEHFQKYAFDELVLVLKEFF